MPSIIIPAAIRKVADRYKSCCGMPYGVLSTMLYSAASGASCLSDVVKDTGWSPSISALSRGIALFDGQAVLKRQRKSLLKRLKGKLTSDKFCFAVDDTTVERFGDEIYGIGYQRRHGKSGAMRGQRIMVLVLVDMERGIAYPLSFSMCFNVGTEEHVSGHNLCFSLVKAVIDEGFPRLITVADSWFDSFDLLKKFDANELTLVVEAKSNRRVKWTASSKEPWKSWKELLGKQIRVGVKIPKSQRATRAKTTKYVATRRARIKGRSGQVIACAVYNRSSDSDFFAVYHSNDLSLSGADLWVYSRARWRIEEMFRILKQNLGFLSLPLRGKQGCFANICMSFLVLCSIYIEPELWNGNEKYSVGRTLGIFKETELNILLNEMCSGSKRISICYLRARRRLHENQNKPVNLTADEIVAFRNCA